MAKHATARRMEVKRLTMWMHLPPIDSMGKTRRRSLWTSAAQRKLNLPTVHEKLTANEVVVGTRLVDASHIKKENDGEGAWMDGNASWKRKKRPRKMVLLNEIQNNLPKIEATRSQEANALPAVRNAATSATLCLAPLTPSSSPAIESANHGNRRRKSSNPQRASL